MWARSRHSLARLLTDDAYMDGLMASVVMATCVLMVMAMCVGAITTIIGLLVRLTSCPA